jgi:hypothetical protein
LMEVFRFARKDCGRIACALRQAGYGSFMRPELQPLT